MKGERENMPEGKSEIFIATNYTTDADLRAGKGRPAHSEEVKQEEVPLTEKEPSSMNFQESLKEYERTRDEFLRLREIPKDQKDDDLRLEQEYHRKRAQETGSRMQQILSDMKTERLFDDINREASFARDELTDLMTLRNAGVLSLTQVMAFKASVRDRIRSARSITEDEPEDDEYRGAREYVYTKQLEMVLDQAKDLEQSSQVQTEGNENNPEIAKVLKEGIEGLASELNVGVAAMVESSQAMAREYELGLPKIEDLTNPTPVEIERQRQFVREYLNVIEDSNRDCMDMAINVKVRLLETSMRFMAPEIADEVHIRLAVHDSSELMKQANGFITRPEGQTGHTISSAASEAVRRKHELDETVVDWMLTKGKLKGLKTSEAWDLLQEVNYNYRRFIEEVNETTGNTFPADAVVVSDDEKELGMVSANYFTDQDPERRRAVEQLLLTKLGGGEVARKSLQLAEKLTLASRETSVFNRSAKAGNDEPAEIFGLKGWRLGRKRAGRARGPAIHEGYIHGFGTSWMRKINQDLLSKRAGEQEVDTINDVPLYAQDIVDNLDKFEAGNWAGYHTTTMTRYNALKQLLLDREPKVGMDTKNFLQKAIVYFNTADNPGAEKDEQEKIVRHYHDGPMHLKFWWVAGVVDVTLSDPNSTWTGADYGSFQRALTREVLGEREDGSEITFISQEMWDMIAKITRFNSRLTAKGVREGFKASFSKYKRRT